MAGVRPARRARGDALPAATQKAQAVEQMFDRIAPRYDLVNRLITFGLDVGWRRRTVRELGLPPGALVADLACGTGDLSAELHRRGLRPVGFDVAAQMLSRARAHSGPAGRWVRADVLRLPLPHAALDGAVCGFALRNVTDLEAFFAETARVLRVGGRAAFLETAEPGHPLLRAGYRLHFGRIVPAIGGLLSDRDAYRYLPASMVYLPGPASLVEMLRRTGFVDVRRIGLGGGAAQILTGTRSP